MSLLSKLEEVALKIRLAFTAHEAALIQVAETLDPQLTPLLQLAETLFGPDFAADHVAAAVAADVQSATPVGASKAVANQILALSAAHVVATNNKTDPIAALSAVPLPTATKTVASAPAVATAPVAA